MEESKKRSHEEMESATPKIETFEITLTEEERNKPKPKFWCINGSWVKSSSVLKIAFIYKDPVIFVMKTCDERFFVEESASLIEKCYSNALDMFKHLLHPVAIRFQKRVICLGTAYAHFKGLRFDGSKGMCNIIAKSKNWTKTFNCSAENHALFISCLCDYANQEAIVLKEKEAASGRKTAGVSQEPARKMRKKKDSWSETSTSASDSITSHSSESGSEIESSDNSEKSKSSVSESDDEDSTTDK
jgi:hypothetical protein